MSRNNLINESFPLVQIHACSYTCSYKYPGQCGHLLALHHQQTPVWLLHRKIQYSSSSSSSNFIPNRKQSTAYMSKDTFFCCGGHQRSRRLILLATKRVAAIGCPSMQRTRSMDSWTPGNDPHNPPAGTDCTSGPGNHRPWERTHWSKTRCRYALTTGSHKARPEPPTRWRAPAGPSQYTCILSKYSLFSNLNDHSTWH